MAEFCSQCSKEIFCVDYGDLSGLIDPMQMKRGFAASVVCECCGPIKVDFHGTCLTHTDEEHEKIFQKRGVGTK